MKERGYDVCAGDSILIDNNFTLVIVERFIIEYANYLKKIVKNSALPNDTINEFCSRYDKIVVERDRGMITANGAIKALYDLSINL